MVLDLESGDQEVLITGGTNPRYVTSGHILYSFAGTLRAVGFNIDSQEVSGDPFPVLENLETKPQGAANFDVSDDGILAYTPGDGSSSAQQRQLVWVDRDGTEELLDTPTGPWEAPQLSPDGARAIFAGQDGDSLEIWSSEIARGTLDKVTTNPESDSNPIWTPDGEHVVFSAVVDGVPGLYQRSADGTGSVDLLIERRGIASDWSADGSSLVINYQGNDFDIGLVAIGDEPSWEPLLEGEARETHPSISPNGEWIAYASDVSGQVQVYVQRFPELGERQTVSVGGGQRPVWSTNGDEIFYIRRGAGNPDVMMRVEVSTSPTLNFGDPEVLFEKERFRYWMPIANPWRAYDITAEGDRFLMVRVPTAVSDEGGAGRIEVVLNWFEELKERVPVP